MKPKTTDTELQSRNQAVGKHDHRIEHFFRRTLHWIERLIALVTILVMLAAFAYELYNMILGGAEYLSDVSHYLHNVLTVVVGLEFVRMLIDTTPASILEVLTVAITRHVILNHTDPWSNAICVACIAGLFAIRRFLVRKKELTEEMVELD